MSEAAGPLRRVGVFFSGSGRTLANLIHAVSMGTLDAELVLALTNRADAGGIRFARAAGIPVEVVPHENFDAHGFSERLTEIATRYEVGTVALAGFLRLWRIPQPLEWRVLNIHPSLLPAFGGKGFYGDRVHREVYESGVRFTGCTVHYATNEYDQGPIILQRVIAVDASDTPKTIASKVFDEECLAYPRALDWHLSGRLQVRDGRVTVSAPL